MNEDLRSDMRMLARNALHDLIVQTAYKDCLCHYYTNAGCTRCRALELAGEAFPVQYFKVMSALTRPFCLVNGKEVQPWDSTSTTTNQ